MQTKTSLLVSAAAGVLIAVAANAAADAKTTKHHVRKEAPVNETQQQIRGLTAEVEELKARLDAQSGAVSAAQNEAASAHAEAQAAHQQLETQIQTIPGAVQSAVAATVKPSWADNTTVSGRVYADISNIRQSPVLATKANAASSSNYNGTGVDIKRAYLGVEHKFNDVYSANLTIDFAPNGIVAGGKGYKTATTPYAAGTQQGTEAIKYAYVQAKYNPAFVVQLGAAPMPWIPFAEEVYGERYVEKVTTDLNKIANSSDWGAFVHGDFFGDILSYSVAAVDGAGYKSPDRSNTLDFEGRVSAKYLGFVAAVGGYTGKEGLNLATAPGGAPANAGVEPVKRTATRVDALVAYTSPLFHVGVEYYKATNWKILNNLPPYTTTNLNTDVQAGYSAFATYNFLPKWSLFGRYDWSKPTEVLAGNHIAGERLNYFNVGLSYEPAKVVDIALVYKRDSLDNALSGGYTDANAALIPAKAGGSATYDEVGLFTQFRF